MIAMIAGASGHLIDYLLLLQRASLEYQRFPQETRAMPVAQNSRSCDRGEDRGLLL